MFDIHDTGHGHTLSESGLPILIFLDEMRQEIAKPSAAELIECEADERMGTMFIP